MTKDLKLINQCDHRVYEILTISGISPNYYTYLDNIPNKVSHNEIYLDDYTTADNYESFAMIGYNHILNTNIGITNWEYDEIEPKKINFKYNPNIKSVDGNKEIIPQPKYVMSYVTMASNCPKCNNKFKLQDIQLDNIGRFNSVQGYEKVKQQILKILTTVIGNNLYDSNYGSNISSSIGQKFTDYLSASIQQSIYNAIQHLIQIQQEANLPSNETISEITNIKITNTTDPRILILSIIVSTADGNEVSASLNFTMNR